jgi:hypothetical protein
MNKIKIKKKREREIDLKDTENSQMSHQGYLNKEMAVELEKRE